jgi:5-methylthioadenosine/S-adenosylhomocysteine deaminase
MKFGDVHDFLPRALAAGVTVGLGSDGPASNNTMSILETARFAALLAKASRRDPLVARVEEVLPLCHAGGQVLGLPGYGRIQPGSLADLVLIEPGTPSLVPALDPFANLLYSFNERSIHTVIVDGRVLVRQGKLVHVDMEQLHRKASEIAERLKVRSAARPMQTY